jgi:hypothetical protein
MKSKLLALGFAIAALPSMAQEQTVNYNKSVFSNVRSLQRSNPANAALTQQKVQQHFPGMKLAIDPATGSLRDVFGLALAIPGNTLEAKIQYCFSNHLSDLGITSGEWQQVRNDASPRASFIAYEQVLNGHKVIFSRLSFRFTPTGKLERLQLKEYGKAADLAPVLTPENALQAAVNDVNNATITEQHVEADWAWFPVPTRNGYSLRPAYAYNIKGEGRGIPVDLKGFVDAVTGEVLYRSNQVKETTDLTVKGSVNKQNPLVAASVEPLANLAITVGTNTYYTDTAGFFSDAILVNPTAATVKLQGKWSKVNFGAGSAAVTPTFANTITLNGSTYIFPGTTPSADQAVNAYYHVNRVHDFMKEKYPTFSGMDIQLPTNVDITTNSTNNCNAYYNGSSINFYAAYGNCVSFAKCGDIIYHEYGHGISDRFYQAHGAGTMYNGGLNEGNSDIWGMSISKDPVLGKGAFLAGGNIRRYDLAPKVYPQDIIGEVHADGEIIAGAWWDVALNIGSVDTMSLLFADTYYDVPDGPDGTEGAVYHDVLISALMSDDNDNNLNNGTPHFTQIVAAFAKHGIYLLGDADLNHTEIANQPANMPITVSANVVTTMNAFLQKVNLFYRVRGGSWDSLQMVNTGGVNYTTQIPAQAAGSLLDYYFAIYDNTGVRSASFPLGYLPTLSSGTVTIPYQFGVGLASKWGTDFELTDAAWTIGNVSGDNATAGKWIQAQPIGSYVSAATSTGPVQTSMDHTSGTGKCLVTGNATSAALAIGSADVDNGKTSVITPALDLSGFTEPIIEYYRWYGNDQGSNPSSDYWRVYLKDTAAAGWILTVENTLRSDYSWRRRIFNVKQYLPSSSIVQLKFVADDPSPSGSIVEAGIDDFYIYDKATPNSVQNVKALNTRIFPNPADHELQVHLEGYKTGTISLYDITGREVAQAAISNIADYSFDTRNIIAGSYFLIIKSEKSVESHKVSITH